MHYPDRGILQSFLAMNASRILSSTISSIGGPMRSPASVLVAATEWLPFCPTRSNYWQPTGLGKAWRRGGAFVATAIAIKGSVGPAEKARFARNALRVR